MAFTGALKRPRVGLRNIGSLFGKKPVAATQAVSKAITTKVTPVIPRRYTNMLEDYDFLRHGTRLEAARQYLALARRKNEMVKEIWNHQSDLLLSQAIGVRSKIPLVQQKGVRNIIRAARENFNNRLSKEQLAFRTFLQNIREETMKSPEQKELEFREKLERNWQAARKDLPKSTQALKTSASLQATAQMERGNDLSDAVNIAAKITASGGGIKFITVDHQTGRIRLHWYSANGKTLKRTTIHAQSSTARKLLEKYAPNTTLKELARQFAALNEMTSSHGNLPLSNFDTVGLAREAAARKHDLKPNSANYLLLPKLMFKTMPKPRTKMRLFRSFPDNLQRVEPGE